MVIEHERAIQMVCRRCCSKASKTAKPITPMIKEKFEDVFNTNLDYDKPYHPKVSCPTCYRCLHQDQANDRKLPQGYDFTFHHTRNFTENCTSGQCNVKFAMWLIPIHSIKTKLEKMSLQIRRLQLVDQPSQKINLQIIHYINAVGQRKVLASDIIVRKLMRLQTSTKYSKKNRRASCSQNCKKKSG